MSIAKDPRFNAALTDLAIGTHKHLPNDEIFLVAAVDAYCASQTAEVVAEVEQLKVALYELTKQTVTEGGEGETCSYCGAVLIDEYIDEDGYTVYRELDCADNHKDTCAWRRGLELSMDVHKKKNPEIYATKEPTTLAPRLSTSSGPCGYSRSVPGNDLIVTKGERSMSSKQNAPANRVCRYSRCKKEFAPTGKLRFFCSDACREKHQRNSRRKALKKYDAAHRESRRAMNREYCARPEVKERRRENKRSEEYKERRRQYRQIESVKQKESAANADWQRWNRAARSAYMANWDRRNQAVKSAKRDYAESGSFKLVRTIPVDNVQPCFWRGIATGKMAASGEEIVAFYERLGSGWSVLAPSNGSPDIRKIAETLHAAELRISVHSTIGGTAEKSAAKTGRSLKPADRVWDKNGEFLL